MLLLHVFNKLAQGRLRLCLKMLENGSFYTFPLRPRGVPLKRQHFHNA